jgi:hypothetical protein
MKTIAFAVVGLSLAACQAATNATEPEIRTVASPSAPFAQYRSFSFALSEQPTPGYPPSVESFEIERHVRMLIVDTLNQKGYTEDTGKSDFVVRFRSGRMEVMDSATSQGGESTRSPTRVEQGELAVDVFDTSTQTHVWQGTAVAIIDPKAMDAGLRRAVEQLLGRFPARRTAL